MNGDAVVEVRLGGAHLHGDAEALQDLVHGEADSMQADYLLFRPDADQFHPGGLAMLGQGRVHGGELAAVDLHLIFPVLGNGFRLGQADGADGRVAEHHGRHQIVVEVLARLVVEQPLREAAACRDSHRGELDAAGVVTDGIEVGDGGVLELVGGDEALLVQGDAGGSQIEIVGGGHATDGPDEAVHGEVATIFQLQGQAVVGVLDDGLGNGVGVQLGPFLRHDLHQGLVDHGVEVAQRRMLAHHQMGLGAKCLHHASDLHGDIAGTHHGNPFGLALQVEETVGVDTQFGTRNGRDLGTAAGGNQDVIGAVVLAVHLDGMAVDEAGEALDDGDLVLAQHVLVGLVNAPDIGLTGFDQLGPAEVVERGVEAVVGAIFQGIGDLACIPHGLLRYAADVDAGATQLFGFDQGDFLAVHGCPVGRGDAAAAATDGDVVKMLCHCEVLRSLRMQSQHDGDKAAGPQEPVLSSAGWADECGTGRPGPVRWRSGCGRAAAGPPGCR